MIVPFESPLASKSQVITFKATAGDVCPFKMFLLVYVVKSQILIDLSSLELTNKLSPLPIKTKFLKMELKIGKTYKLLVKNIK